MSDRLWVAAFWLTLLFTAYNAFAPPGMMITVLKLSDIILHGVTFTVLTALLQLAHLPQRPLATAFWMLGYGLFIELVQHWLPGRYAEVKDVLVDCLGIALGLLCYRWFGLKLRSFVRALF